MAALRVTGGPEADFALSADVESTTATFTFETVHSNLNAITFTVVCSEDVPGGKWINISVTSLLVQSLKLPIDGAIPVANFNSELTDAFTNSGVVGISRFGTKASTSPPGTVTISMRASPTNFWGAGEVMGFNLVFNWFKNPTPADDLCNPLDWDSVVLGEAPPPATVPTNEILRLLQQSQVRLGGSSQRAAAEPVALKYVKARSSSSSLGLLAFYRGQVRVAKKAR
jgi:hypothetical protein